MIDPEHHKDMSVISPVAQAIRDICSFAPETVDYGLKLDGVDLELMCRRLWLKASFRKTGARQVQTQEPPRGRSRQPRRRS
jgi:hypothetical protein